MSDPIGAERVEAHLNLAGERDPHRRAWIYRLVVAMDAEFRDYFASQAPRA